MDQAQVQPKPPLGGPDPAQAGHARGWSYPLHLREAANLRWLLQQRRVPFPSDGEWVSCRSAFLYWAVASVLCALWLPAAVSGAVALAPGCCWCRAWPARGEVVPWRPRLPCGAWGKRRGGGRAREKQVEAASLTRATGRWSGLKLTICCCCLFSSLCKGFMSLEVIPAGAALGSLPGGESRRALPPCPCFGE